MVRQGLVSNKAVPVTLNSSRVTVKVSQYQINRAELLG